MSEQDLGPVGELALADTALCELLAEMLTAVWDLEGITDAVPDTTGATANRLLGALKRHAVLVGLAADSRPWLKRVVAAAAQRNGLIHAIALDRCIRCGSATRYEHRGSQVDRSAGAVSATIAEFASLTREGIILASGLSQAVNREYLNRARRHNDKETAPPQIRIGGTLHWCPRCSGDGSAHTVTNAPAVAVALRKEQDLRAMFLAMGGEEGS